MYGGIPFIFALCGMDDGTAIGEAMMDSINRWLAAGRPDGDAAIRDTRMTRGTTFDRYEAMRDGCDEPVHADGCLCVRCTGGRHSEGPMYIADDSICASCGESGCNGSSCKDGDTAAHRGSSNPTRRRIEHLRRSHDVIVNERTPDAIGDALCSGEDAGCGDCSHLLDTWLDELGYDDGPVPISG